jgi:hypothetical protein
VADIRNVVVKLLETEEIETYLPILAKVRHRRRGRRAAAIQP